jgi:hypothetical protein
MIFTKATASEAVLHFEQHYFQDAFKGSSNAGTKDYFRAYHIIQSAKAGTVSDKRAKWLLETYGGGRYKCSTVFEVEAGSNGAAFGEAARSLGEALNEFIDPVYCPYCGNKASLKKDCVETYKGTEYTFDKYVCDTDPSHEWQTADQMDRTVSSMIDINKQRKNP